VLSVGTLILVFEFLLKMNILKNVGKIRFIIY